MIGLTGAQLATIGVFAVPVLAGSMLATSIVAWRRRNRQYWSGRW